MPDPSPVPLGSNISAARPVKAPPAPPQPMAALLAFAFPGAGHLFLGYRARAVRIAAGVLLLFIVGLGIGGLDAVDRKENGLWFWFYGQMWTGPLAFGVDYLHQTEFKVIDHRGAIRSAAPNEFRNPVTGAPELINVDENGVPWAKYQVPGSTNAIVVKPAYPPKRRSSGRASELGTLFIAIAGMLNLVAIIDAMFKPRAAPGHAH
jgi:hypothetical protein